MYQSPRSQQLEDGRAEMQATVRHILDNSKTKLTPRPRTRVAWNAALGRYVELR